MEPISVDGRYATPYQLCAFCRRIYAKYSQDIFWDDKLYKKKNNTFQSVNTEAFGRQTRPLAHHTSLANLQKSASGGCHLCTIFSETRRNRGDKRWGHNPLYVRVSGRPTDHCRELWIEMYESNPSQHPEAGGVIHVHMHRHAQGAQLASWHVRTDIHPMGSIEDRYRWSTTTDCDEGYEMMKSWLQHCVTNHESCRRSLDDVRPARLLDLNAFSNNQDIRLVHVEDIGKQAYASLSYSWGERVCVKLKADTYEAFSSRIVLEALPQTVQDAVKVCRHLLVQYLWVDALCIIQEDGEDFAQAISQMGSIYAGSLVTLAVGDSTDCESGMFRSRSPLYTEECVIINEGEAFTFCRGIRLGQLHSHRELISACKLNKRGWVYQERMMSPRTIHFIRNEVVWECRERTCCHNCTWKVPQSRSSYAALDLKKTFLTLHHDWQHHRQEVDLLRIWSDILSEYTRVLFSNADDRLSALAGIAQLVCKNYQYQASYGIWLEKFLDGLLWRALTPVPVWGNSKVLDLAPSWSWVSNRSRIWYQSTTSLYPNPRSSYLDVSQTNVYSALITKLPPATPFAQISTLSKRCSEPASIRLLVRVRPCQIVRYFNWQIVPMSGRPNEEVESFLRTAWKNYETNIETYLPEDKMQHGKCERFGMSFSLFFQPDEKPKQRKDLFCLLLKRVFSEADPQANYMLTGASQALVNTVTDFGIVCEPIDPARRLWRRVGYFHEFVKVDKIHGSSSKGSSSARSEEYEDVIEEKTTSAKSVETKVNSWQSEHVRATRSSRRLQNVSEKSSAVSISEQSESSQRAIASPSRKVQKVEGEPTAASLPNLQELLSKLTLFRDEYEEMEIELV